MTENPRKQDETTPQGAIEVHEEDLDQASGGVSSGGDRPTESFSLNFSKIDFAGQKVAPQVITGAGPGGGPHVVPQKKL